MPAEPPPTLGVLLAGGLSRRMGGGDKCLHTLGGRPLLDHVIERARPQCAAGLVLNANGPAGRFAGFGLPVVPDVVPGAQGPLAGVLTGLRRALDEHPGVEWVVTIATDTPFFPKDLVARLHAGRAEAGLPLACAMSGGRTHPVFGLWPVVLADDLERALVDEELRKVDVWTARQGIAHVDFADRPFDPFFNTNRPEDLDAAERLLSGA